LDAFGNPIVDAKDVLDCILKERTLKASNTFCIFNRDLEKAPRSFKEKFNVVCFTETPIDQIGLLLREVYGRDVVFKPYGVVFRKDYIRQHEGNPVFYMAGKLASPLWKLYNEAKNTECSEGENKLLALMNKCDESVDFHWEREWRIVGDLKFKLNDVYCCLCPEEDVSYFETRYREVKFMSPYWGINKILDNFMQK